ncbi:hypothetical protein N665_0349s0017 [Sinapis alba]|nr:hypothetical protein N665_0349s0017 [Sinapis alba]
MDSSGVLVAGKSYAIVTSAGVKSLVYGEGKEVETVGSVMGMKETPRKSEGSKSVGSVVRAEANETVGTGLIKTGGKKWEEISPGKACRTPSKQLEYGQVSIMSKSRFSVLSSEEEEGEIMETQEGVNVINKEEEEEGGIEEEKEEELEESQLKSEEDKIYMRQYLPRGSKNKHKFLNVTVQRTREDGPSDQNKKKKSRKGH